MNQFDDDTRNDWLAAWISNLGASPKLVFYGGNNPPVDCAAAPSSEVRLVLTLPSSPFGTPASGEVAKSGTWSVSSAVSTGPIDHARLWDNGLTTCRWQGLVTQGLRLTTSSSTGANGNVLTFADTTGVLIADTVAGAGIPDNTSVLAKTSTTVTIDRACEAGVGSGVDVVFGDASGDLVISSTVVTSLAQGLTIDYFTVVAPGA